MKPEVAQIALQEFRERMKTLYSLADRLATLASGALALTVTFLHGHQPQSEVSLWCIRLSWIGFTATVAGFLLIHVAKIWMHSDLIRRMQAEDSAIVKSNPPRYFHVGLYLLIGGFSLGILFLALFGVLQG